MEKTKRQTYLDWLRIMAIIGVLFFHAAMPFVAEEPWHIKNKETSNLLLEFNFWLSRFRMPLLFFISGTVNYFMLLRRGPGAFIGLRFRRLFVPLFFGMLLLVPVQVYLERVNNGFEGNFVDFYPSLFTTGVYPEGNLSWHHLWFIAYLFVYDVLFAPVFKWAMSERGRRSLSFFNRLGKDKSIYLLTLPSVLLFPAMTLRFPETHDLVNDWSQHVYWISFLLGGFICISRPALMDSLERNRRFSMSMAVLSIIAINYFRWNDLAPWDNLPGWRTDWRTYVYLSLYPATAWLWVFAAIGYGRRYLNRPHPAMAYINNAVYPFYILHQTIIVVLAFYVVKTSDTILMKYGFIVILTLVLSMAIYHLFIRPFAITGFLFGAKKANQPPDAAPAASLQKRIDSEWVTS